MRIIHDALVHEYTYIYIWGVANNAVVHYIRNHYVGDVVHRGHNTLIIGAI